MSDLRTLVSTGLNHIIDLILKSVWPWLGLAVLAGLGIMWSSLMGPSVVVTAKGADFDLPMPWKQGVKHVNDNSLRLQKDLPNSIEDTLKRNGQAFPESIKAVTTNYVENGFDSNIRFLEPETIGIQKTHSVWHVTIQNNSSTMIHNCELLVPDSGWLKPNPEDEIYYDREPVFRNKVKISDIKPGLSYDLTLWSESLVSVYTPESVKFSYDGGLVPIQIPIQVDGVEAKLYKWRAVWLYPLLLIVAGRIIWSFAWFAFHRNLRRSINARIAE